MSRLTAIYKVFAQTLSFEDVIKIIKTGYNEVIIGLPIRIYQSITTLDRFYKSLAEQITINAIVIRTRTVFTTISSWFSATTSALNLSNFYRAVSSYFNINQNFVRLQALIRPFTQSLTFTDTSTRFLQFYKTVTTYFNINQVSTVGQSLIRSFTNSLNVSTSIANAFSLIRNFAASFIINTASQRIMTAYQTFYQPAAYFDQAIDRIYSYFRPVTALFNIGTGFDRNIHLTLNFLNSFTLNAIGTIGNAFQQIVTASINFADSIARTLYLNINFADSFSINTVITRLRTISKYVTTGFSISDSIYRFIIITRELPQGLFITHSLERAQNLMREFLQTLIFSAHGFKPPLFYNRIFDLSLTLSQSTERLQAIGRIFVQSLNINGAFTRTLSLTRFFYEGFNFFVSLFMQFLCPWLSTESSCLSVGFCHWCSGACQAPECPTPPSGTPPPSGSPITPPPIEPVLPITLSTNIIEVRLYPGEYQIIPIGITNNKNENVQVSLSVEGDIWPFTLFEKDKLTVAAKQTEYAKVKFFTMPTTIPGIYNGVITLASAGTTQKITVILRVEYEREKLLDIKIDTIKKEVIPGDSLKYQVTLYNLGLTKRIDVFLNYTVRSVETDNIIAVDKETMAVETSLSFIRNLHIPEVTEPGLYTIEALAWYENKTASSVASFSVVKPPWIFSLLVSIFTNWMTYIILFIAIPSFYLGWKLYEKWKLRKIRGRYIKHINPKKLPSKGLLIGKVEETKINAFIDESKLTTHMIIAGGTGSGKTVAGMDIAEECLKKGIPVIVFDPTVQWTGFVRSCKDKSMLSLYGKFGIKQEEARGFKGTIVQVKDPFLKIEVDKYIKEGEITVFTLNKLTPDQLDYFIGKTIDYMFTVPWKESRQLKALVIFDEIHRLLPKYIKRTGVSVGAGEGYIAVERACREFRKWGLGLMMISQVLLDFKGAIRAVIATETQMRTKYEGDIERIKTKYGWEYSTSIPKLEVGAGMIQNPEYNDGKPWFIRFRPLLHDTFRMTEEELSQYDDYMKEIEDLNKKIKDLKDKNVDTYDMELETSLALEKVKTAQMSMAETYIDSVKSRIKTVEERS
jgi:hypothetical protein